MRNLCGRIFKYIKLMRVHHWIKNLLIAVPLFFSRQFIYPAKIYCCIFGIAVFSLISSAIYIFNDIVDAGCDRNHPVKCKRPIASGAVSRKSAVVLCIILLAAAAVCSVPVAERCGIAGAAVVPLVYISLNILYSLGMKNKPLVDITILMSCYLVRIIYGALLTEVEISGWLYLTVISAAFFFALGKRRNEIGAGEDTRAVLKYYTKEFLDKNMYVFLGMTNTFYALWAMGCGSKGMICTVPPMMLIFLRYTMKLESDSDGDPVDMLIHDIPLLALCLIFGAAVMAMVFLEI